MVGDRLPIGEYPLSAAPASLAPLNRAPLTPGAIRIEGGPRQKRTLPWNQAMGLLAVAQAPGRLRLLINGVDVRDYAFFDYDARPRWDCLVPSDLGAAESAVSASPTPVGVADGKSFTLEVVPEGVSGDWYVDFATGKPSDRAIMPSSGQTCGLLSAETGGPSPSS